MKIAGKYIVVVESGFVYIGECSYRGEFLKIENCLNVRAWGTTKGLGQLINGPTKETVTDPCGTVIVPKGKVILFLEIIKGWM